MPALIGLALGALTLTRGWLSPCTLALALFLCTRFLDMPAGAHAARPGHRRACWRC